MRYFLLTAFLALAASASAQVQDPVLTGKEAFGDWRQDKPGVRRLIRPQDLPPAARGNPRPTAPARRRCRTRRRRFCRMGFRPN